MSDLPKKILHVDDDFALRELIRAVFNGIDGFELKTAKDGIDALEQLEGYDADLVLLDLSMPGMDGPSFLRKMQDKPGSKGTPVIFITQFDNVTMQGGYEALGVIGVLHKPIHAEYLLKEIRDIWQNRKAA